MGTRKSDIFVEMFGDSARITIDVDKVEPLLQAVPGIIKNMYSRTHLLVEVDPRFSCDEIVYDIIKFANDAHLIIAFEKDFIMKIANKLPGVITNDSYDNPEPSCTVSIGDAIDNSGYRGSFTYHWFRR